MKDMQKLVQGLPQFQDQLDKLSLHIHVSATLLGIRQFIPHNIVISKDQTLLVHMPDCNNN